MKEKLLSEGAERTFVLVLDAGDEVMREMNAFARRHRLSAARFTAIGALEQATLAFFHRDRREYSEIPVNEQVEVLSLMGDIALFEGEPKVHAHAVLGRSDGQTVGGHFKEGRVWPTLEVLIIESAAHLRRTYDPKIELPLLNPSA
jgi:uncharacterized protein